MPRTVERLIYKFEELSDKAKEKARDWYRECIEADELTDYDDWNEIADILGVDFKQKSVRLYGGGTRYDPDISFSLGYCQGDGASYDAHYKFAKQAPKRIRDHAPMDEKLHAIADALADVQKRNGYKLTAQTHAHDVASYSMEVNVSDARKPDEDPTPEADEIVTAQLRAFADWIYDQIRAQNDYLTSDEAVDESILLNVYEFEEDGSRTRD